MDKLKLKLKLIAEDFEEEAFYEDIEAPKFVDLTRSDPFVVDDRYWFCSRVGCDLKHEQEIDVEAIYKNFALRAMAARSPNLRFQKALNKRRENKKCPLSAPPKSSKSRIPRLALLSSVSRKLLDAKDTTQPPPKPTSTPKPKVKHVAAKYMTTPRVKNPVGDSKPFRSVRNQPRTTSSSIPKPKLVAKVLTFASPKKKVMKAKALEDQTITTTPIKKLCDGMKKLEITDQKKGTTGELRSARACKKVPDQKKGTTGELRSARVCKKVLGNTKTREENEKFSRRVDSKIKGVAQKKANSKYVLCEVETRDISSLHMDSNTAEKGVAEKKSNTKSVLCEVETGDISSQRMDINTAEERSCFSGPCSESAKPENGEGTIGSSDTETLKCGPISSQDTTEERILVESGSSGIEGQRTEENHSNEGSEIDQNPSSDEKENAPFCDINRDFTANHGQSEGDHGVKHEASKKTKVVQTINKGCSKENRPGGVGFQGLKYKKQKTTNPKPFRLRTDERMILKEATLERKQQEDENQINVNSTGKVQYGINKSKKNQEALMGTKAPYTSTLTKGQLESCKSQQKDANKKVSTSTKSAFLQKREQRTLQRAMVSQVKPEGDKACSSLWKRPTITPKSCTR